MTLKELLASWADGGWADYKHTCDRPEIVEDHVRAIDSMGMHSTSSWVRWLVWQVAFREQQVATRCRMLEEALAEKANAVTAFCENPPPDLRVEHGPDGRVL